MLHRGGFGFGADFVENPGAVVPIGLYADLDQFVHREGAFDFGQHRAGQALVADQHDGNQ